MRDMDQVRRYYASHYGAADNCYEFRASDGCAIDVLEWGPEKSGEDVFLFASVGAVSWLHGPHTLCECFIGLSRAVSGVPATIAEVCADGVGGRQAPDPGDTITLPEPLWEGTAMTALLFTDGDELLPPMRLDGKPVRFLQLVPLHPAELEYKRRRGEEAMWELFESQEVPYWDPLRPPAKLGPGGR